MRSGKVGDVVWYSSADETELAQIVAIRNTRTHATIRVLTGSQKGQAFEAPWGKIEFERKSTE